MIALDSCGCVCPRPLACKPPASLLAPRSGLAFPPSLRLSLASPAFPSARAPGELREARREAARSLARSPRWLPSTGLGPSDSPPPSRAEIWEEKTRANSSGVWCWLLLPLLFFFFLLVINPDEVSCLRFPFRAVVFLARDECFGGPRPLVFWGGLACKGAGVLNTFGNYSFLVVVEGVGQPRALPLLIPRRWADGGTGIWGSRGWERGVRLHLRCLSACGDSGHLDRTAQASEEEVAGFLVATVFVFWALRDSVLAPDGCSLLFLNSILLYFFFSRGASSVLKKKKK